ncbi:MAG: SPO1 DNA polymerase [Rhodospirillaceae bacterium]|nr:SPO1 DNA polymerase [Rhodospirillaceae bacterium]|tara:strand:- start:392 stop:1051 length:660 start_codon:yes stop_codon:yes gene_type:complete
MRAVDIINSSFKKNCTLCPRLASHLQTQRLIYPEYFNLPVPAFGDPDAGLLIVGLAPGHHGANATGRPFTGDHAGILLYKTLFELGLCTKTESISADDNLRLLGCRITNAVKCLPPKNRPTTEEIRTCNPYLRHEISLLRSNGVIFALGGIAHAAVLRAYKAKLSEYKFIHGHVHSLPDSRVLVDSYHCSRYNTNTGRLTPSMLKSALELAQSLTTQNL